jgi:myosin-crossreactive antigen
MTKKKIKLVEVPEEEIIDRKIVYNMGASMADADPAVYGKLLRDGKLKEAKKMLNEKGYYVQLDDGSFM